MRKIYLYLTSSMSVLGLIAQSASALAETSQPTVIPELIVTNNTKLLVDIVSWIEVALPKQPYLLGNAYAQPNLRLNATGYEAVAAAASPEVVADTVATSNAIPATATVIVQAAPATTPEAETEPTAASMDSVTSVSQLSDVQPTDWAFQTLQFLVERYGCIAGYPDGTYRGNRTLTRYEFAAGLNACLDQVNELMATATADLVTGEDLVTLQRLQEEFSAELASLRGRVDSLEASTRELEANQFSTTTKIAGLAIFAVTGGGFSGDRIIAPTGAVIATENPNATLIYRASLDFNTSFFGTDLLKVRLVTGSDGPTDNAAGFLEPNFASVLDFSVPGRDDQFGLGRLYYTFTPFKDFKVTLGTAIVAPDFVDQNSYANNSFLDFSTQALINNFILLPRPAGAGAVIDWNPGEGPFKLRAMYVAANAAGGNADSQRFIGGPSAPVLIFPNRGGEGGLFGDPYQGIVELEYSPDKAFTLRLQYSGGSVFDSRFNVFGVNFELALSPRLGVFGRYGYGDYPNTFQGDINPNYWMAGVAFRDLFVPRALAGIAAGQPFIENAVGNATQTNIEAFYNLPISYNIRITPLVQVIIDPGNQNSNGTIVTGTLRTVFSF